MIINVDIVECNIEIQVSIEFLGYKSILDVEFGSTVVSLAAQKHIHDNMESDDSMYDPSCLKTK
jgi:hypothetical protein